MCAWGCQSLSGTGELSTTDRPGARNTRLDSAVQSTGSCSIVGWGRSWSSPTQQQALELRGRRCAVVACPRAVAQRSIEMSSGVVRRVTITAAHPCTSRTILLSSAHPSTSGRSGSSSRRSGWRSRAKGMASALVRATRTAATFRSQRSALRSTCSTTSTRQTSPRRAGESRAHMSRAARSPPVCCAHCTIAQPHSV